MVERSIASFVVIMAAMAYVTRAVARVRRCARCRGFFAGYGALAIAMAADCSPPDRLASAIGTVQTAQRLGPAVGPVIGGSLAAVVGLRHAFLVASAFYVVGFVLVLVLYREGPAAEPAAAQAAPRRRLGARAGWPCPTCRDCSWPRSSASSSWTAASGPILPLYLAEVAGARDHVALASGVLFSLAAGFGAIGNVLCARWLARWSPPRVIAVAALVAALGAVLFAVVPPLPVLFVASALFGASIGTATTAAYTRAGRVIPTQVRASGFGVVTSASLVGLALSPVASGALAGWSLPAVFVADVVILAIIAWAVARWMGSGGGEASAPERPVLADA